MSNVIIGDILPYTQATATSGQTVFGTNWTADAASDVVVYQRAGSAAPNDQTQILDSSLYTVAFIGGSQEVQVTLVSGATLGDIVTITRQTPADRMNLYSNTNFTPSMLNEDFGILTLVDQQAQLVNQLIGPRYNYSAVITDVVDTILPILPASSIWMKNSGNTAITTTTIGTAASKDATNTLYQYVSSVNPSPTPVAGHAVIFVDNLGTIGDSGAPPGVGTVNNLLAGTGIALSPNPITVSGTISLADISAFTLLANNTALSAAPLPLALSTFLFSANNLSDLTNAATARANLGVTIGTNVEAWSAILDEVAAGTWAGATSITTLGTLTTGTWHASPITGTYIDTNTVTNSNLAQMNADTLKGNNTGSPATPADLTTTEVVSMLGLVIGTDVEAWSAILDEVAAGTWAGATSITTLGTITTGTWDATAIAINHGGTGVTSVTTAPTANAWAGWDANKNLSANNVINDYTSTATAGGTTTLTVASTYYQYFTGSTTQTVQMPDVTTLTLGQSWTIVNLSSGNVTVESSGGNSIQVLAPGSNALVTCISLTGTTASSWNAIYIFNSGASGTVNTGSTGQIAYYAGNGNAVSGTNAGTGVITALGVNVGSAGAFVVYDGALGTPSSGTATNLTGLPIAGITGLGTGVGTALANPVTGSGDIVLATSPTVTGLTTDTLTFSDYTKGIVGTTAANDAGSGYVGQFVSSVVLSGSPITLTANTAADVTSISLTAGDWDITGNVRFGAASGEGFFQAWASTTSATLPDATLYTTFQGAANFLAACNFGIPSLRVNVSTTTTVYLSARSGTTGTTAAGQIFARRVR